MLLSPLMKGQSVDTFTDRRRMLPSSSKQKKRIHRTFSSFDEADRPCDRPHNSDQGDDVHSKRPRGHIVEPPPPIFRRHSNSYCLQKRRGQQLKDRTATFDQTMSSTKFLKSGATRHSLPPRSTTFRHHAVSVTAISGD